MHGIIVEMRFMSFESPEEWKGQEAMSPAAHSLPREPDYLIPPLYFEETFQLMRFESVEEAIDDVLYWDENKNLLYIEAVAVFKDTFEFVRFRRDLPTRLHLEEYACPFCGCREWKPKNVDAKTVKDEKGKTWKCISVIFACSDCLEEGRVSERSIKIQGIKYALIKFGRGFKDFLDRIKRIKLNGDLSKQSGSITIEVGEQKLRLRRCPLL